MRSKQLLLVVAILLLLGCSDDHKWQKLKDIWKGGAPGKKKATIDTSEFVSGQLRIIGSCPEEGKILFVMPATKGARRIIGSPKCYRGRYEVITSTFGRPPCAVVVEYGGSKSIKAKVKGTEFYCP